MKILLFCCDVKPRTVFLANIIASIVLFSLLSIAAIASAVKSFSRVQFAISSGTFGSLASMNIAALVFYLKRKHYYTVFHKAALMINAVFQGILCFIFSTFLILVALYVAFKPFNFQKNFSKQSALAVSLLGFFYAVIDYLLAMMISWSVCLYIEVNRTLRARKEGNV